MKNLLARTVTFSLLSILAFHSLANAQQPALPFGPSSNYNRAPTFSPWLGLFRNDVGALPNYFQFVRPQIQLRRSIANQTRKLERQDQAIQSLNQQISRPTSGPTGRSTTRLPGFMNYSTFYYQGLPK